MWRLHARLCLVELCCIHAKRVGLGLCVGWRVQISSEGDAPQPVPEVVEVYNAAPGALLPADAGTEPAQHYAEASAAPAPGDAGILGGDAYPAESDDVTGGDDKKRCGFSGAWSLQRRRTAHYAQRLAVTHAGPRCCAAQTQTRSQTDR